MNRIMDADAAAQWLTVAMLVSCPLTLLSGVLLHYTSGIAAPYGRFSAKAGPGWGPLLPGRLAWVVSFLLLSTVRHCASTCACTGMWLDPGLTHSAQSGACSICCQRVLGGTEVADSL